jgi:hypothetical protein
MTIAMKSGRLILKNSRFATTCSCCGCNIPSPVAVYYGRKDVNGLSLNFDNYPSCVGPDLGAEKITGTFSQSRSFRFWRNVYSLCESESFPTTITAQTVDVLCNSGSISVNGQQLSSAQSRTFSSITFINSFGDVSRAGTAGQRIDVEVLSSPASYSVEATLDWDTPRDHDLYGIVECYNPAP